MLHRVYAVCSRMQLTLSHTLSLQVDASLVVQLKDDARGPRLMPMELKTGARANVTEHSAQVWTPHRSSPLRGSALPKGSWGWGVSLAVQLHQRPFNLTSAM